MITRRSPGREDRPRTSTALLVVLAVLLAALAAVLGVAVAGRVDPTSVDGWFYAAVAHPAGRSWLARMLWLAVTTPVLVGAVALLVAVLALRRRAPRLALLAVLAPPVAAALASLVLKPVFDRTYHGYLSYPSGHTTFLVATLAVVVIANRRLLAVAVPVAAVGMFGLVAGRYHYLSDTVGGAALGCAVTLALWVLLRGAARPVPAPPPDVSTPDAATPDAPTPDASPAVPVHQDGPRAGG